MVYTQNDDKSAMSVTYHTWEREKKREYTPKDELLF